jgi:RNA polymerase sigma-B factor
MQDVDELFQRLPDSDARDELVATFRPLAFHIARRYADRGEELGDLRQVATIGLIKAIDRYDPRQGRFTTFAVPTISGEVKRHFRDNVWALGVPRRLKDQVAASRRSHQELSRVLGRSPTAGEVATRVGVSEQVVLELRAVGNAYRPHSLDALQRTGDTALIDRLGDSDAAVEKFDDFHVLEGILASMNERDRRVLFLRFHHEMTQAAIAGQIGVSQMEVSRMLRRSVRDIRVRLQEAEEQARRPVAVCR